MIVDGKAAAASDVPGEASELLPAARPRAVSFEPSGRPIGETAAQSFGQPSSGAPGGVLLLSTAP